MNGTLKIIETFETRHKIISLLGIIIVTILVTRLLVLIVDLNWIIYGFEVHHFYYGLILLIIVSLTMLYQRTRFRFNLIFLGIALGLITDEFVFIGTQIRDNGNYPSPLSSLIIFTIIILFLVEFIFYRLGKKRE
mgnify:CR=1 FL=1